MMLKIIRHCPCTLDDDGRGWSLCPFDDCSQCHGEGMIEEEIEGVISFTFEDKDDHR